MVYLANNRHIILFGLLLDEVQLVQFLLDSAVVVFLIQEDLQVYKLLQIPKKYKISNIKFHLPLK